MRLPPRQVSAPDTDFNERLGRLCEAPRALFWREAFRRDAKTRAWAERKQLELGERADECGRACAAGLRARLPGQTPDELCAHFGLELKEFAIPASPNMEIFALFEAPRAIYLRGDLMANCDRYVDESGLRAYLGGFSCRETILAHELFHYLEESGEPDAAFPQSYTEPRGLLGRPTAFQPLSEIAAMSFARALLDLPWSPFLLDCVMMGMNDMPSARAILARLEHDAANSAEAQHGTPIGAN